jgi:hypothetical protein
LIWQNGTLDDGKIENESYFLYKLAEMIKIPDAFVTESIADAFITKHKNSYFNYSNPVKHFYDQTISVITITRNKNRLVKEIVQSRDLMILLQSLLDEI